MNSFELKKEYEQKLKESGEKFRLLFDTIPDALYIIDQETGKILDVNKAAEKLYGYSREEWLQMKNTDVSAEHDKTKKATNNLPSQIPIRYHKKKDGTIFPLEMMISSYRLNDQRLIIASGRDITESKKLFEEEIKKHREMIENLDVGYFSVNMDGLVTYANNAFKKMAGFKISDNLIGEKTLKFWVNLKDRQNFINMLMRDGYIENYSFKAKRKNGEEIVVEVNAHLVRDSNDVPIGFEGTFNDTTERVKLEQKLLKREKSLIRAQEIAKLGFWDWNVITGELYWSDEIYRQYGFKPKEVIPTFEMFASIVHSEDLEYVQKNVNAVLEDNAKYDIDFRIIQPSGEINYIYTKGEVIRDVKGKAIRFVGTQIDITERKLALKNLEESEKRLKYILSTNPVVIYISKASGDYGATFISENIVAQTGYTAEDFTNDSRFWADKIHPDERERVLSEFSHIFETGNYTNEYRFRYKDGKYHWMRDASLLVYDEEGNPKEMLGSWIDITDRKNLEQKLISRSRKIEILNEIILTANKAEDFDVMIKNIYDLTLNLMDFDAGGVYIADHIKNIANLIYYQNLPSDFVEMIKQIPLNVDPFTTIFIKGEPIFSENYQKFDPVFSEKSGLLTLASIPIFSNEKVTGALNIASKKRHEFSDEEKDTLQYLGHEIGTLITKMKLEEELKEYRDHLEVLVEKRTVELNVAMTDLKRSNAELEQFAYVASHDLQEPLRMVASFTQLLQNRYKDKLDDEANEFINFAVDGATRMQVLINDLLTFSRIGTKGISLETTDMNIILEDVLANILPSSIEADAEITFDPLPVIIADGSQMVQILQNLISNAIKFHGESPIHIHVSGENKRDKWVFSVKDNGIGIESKYFELIFVIFQRLHNRGEYEGTGIGLAVCKKIIECHDGKIWVESELGKGSTFYFSIPKLEGAIYGNLR